MATFVILLDKTDFFLDVSGVYNRHKVVSWNANIKAGSRKINRK